MRKFLICLTCIKILATATFAHQEGIVAEELLKATTAWNGDVLPAYPEGQPQITLLKITIPPQTRLPWHKHPVINAGILLEGELQVTAEDGRVIRLKEGEALAELVDEWHYGENVGDEPAVILVFYAGAVGQPVTVLKEESRD